MGDQYPLPVLKEKASGRPPSMTVGRPPGPSRVVSANPEQCAEAEALIAAGKEPWVELEDGTTIVRVYAP